MGVKKGRKLSDEQLKRLRMTRERKKLGYTRHVKIAGKMAIEQAKELCTSWNVNILTTLFVVAPYDLKLNLLSKLSVEDVEFDEAIEKALEFLKMKKVGEVGIRSYDGRVMAETGETGNVVHVEKKGKEFLVEDYYHF